MNADDEIRLDINSPMRIASTDTRIIVVSTVDRFRQLAEELPTCHDSVLEIGCSTGEATRRLAIGGARIVAVDIANELVARVQADLAGLDNVTVVKIDGRNTPGLVELMPDPDLVFVDIGGGAQLDNVCFQIRQCLLVFEPRLLVVRSEEFATLASLITDIEHPDESALLHIDTSKKPEHVLRNLLDLSESSSIDNRVFAAHRLKTLKTPTARKRLRQMAQDPHPRVRRIAQSGY